LAHTPDPLSVYHDSIVTPEAPKLAPIPIVVLKSIRSPAPSSTS
jgi:hypothetical protein